METKIINPWTWQDNFGYAQAIEVRNNQGTLYCAGQTAVNAQGQPVNGNMEAQIELSLSNLQTVVDKAGYHIRDIVRINLYTTDIASFFAAYGTLAGWMGKHGIRPASTLVEVKALAYPDLKVEIEATLVG